MKLSDRYDGSADPFEGDRILLLKTIPVGARIARASAVVAPVDATRGVNPFAETINFNGASGSWGATKTAVAGRWVEVDFHARRTLSGVVGSRLTSTTLQVDIGGAFVEINANGGIGTPNGAGLFILSGDSAALPSLTVTKFKLTNPQALTTAPDITQLMIRSTPLNVSLRVGDSPALWTRTGELVRPETTPDMTVALQAALSDAKTENGFYLVPVVLHSDAIARLTIHFEIEYLVEQSLLPENLTEITLPFDYGGVPLALGDLLQLEIPPNSRISASGTSARIEGTFDSTRLVAETNVTSKSSETIEVSPSQSQAQPVRVSAETQVTDVDLLLGAGRAARLQLDLREDFDGKPASASLLPTPVEFELESSAKGDVTDAPKWVSVHLPAEFKFKGQIDYWLVLQSVEGEVGWFVAPAPDATGPGLQSTNDGGLSWRATALRPTPARRETGPLRAFFRLRRVPQQFEMPIELQVGAGERALRVGLERFQALGRVDFTLDASDLAGAVNQYLSKVAAAPCPEVEHVLNGDLEQWLRVGDALMRPLKIPLKTLPRSLAVAPDGTWGYVGLSSGQAGALQLFDVACNVLRGDEIPLLISPDVLLISSDGSHAYVTDRALVQVIDTNTHQPLGVPFDPGLGFENGRVEAIVLSPEGGRLYVIQSFKITNAGIGCQLYVLDTDKLLKAVSASQPNLEEARIVAEEIEFPAAPTALAIAPDESRLYVTVPGRASGGAGNRATGVGVGEARGELHVIETANLRGRAQVIRVGHLPEAIALTPDGKQALVADSADNTVSFITTATGSRSAPAVLNHSLSLSAGPCAIAIAPDGLRAYVACRESAALTHLDMTRRAIVKTISIGKAATAVALTPSADTIYTLHPDIHPTLQRDDFLSAVQIGLRLPIEWNLTSGWVTPLCLPSPFRWVALLGQPQQQEIASRLDASQTIATTLSQVVPVAGGCAYDFSFRGISSEGEVLAEVFWLNAECRLLQTDKLFLEAIPTSAANDSNTLSIFKANLAVAEKAPLVLHRRRLSAPAGVAQAEIRFTVPTGEVAAIDGVSLIGTTEEVENPDLTLQSEGRLVGWQLSTGAAMGVSLVASEDGVRFRNAGAATSELVQSIPTGGRKNFALEWRGQSEVRPTARENPRLELHWLDDQNERAGNPLVIELSPANFGTASAKGEIPAKATRAETHLVVPPGTTQTVERLSLRFLPATVVPITFVAQAPGELTIHDWRVAFERAEPASAPIPKGGLCQPTPPGQTPGAATAAGDHSQFCPHCESRQTVKETGTVSTASKRSATLGSCASCGSEVVRFGGKAAASASTLAARRSQVARPILHLSSARTNAALTASLNVRASVPAQPFASVKGIGEVRTKELAALGIDSIAALANAAPEDVAQAKSIPPTLAPNLIAQAKDILGQKEAGK
jgi:DNA-binding beta-propeller fold protein YncE